ncbi:hypothetical protein [Xanthocytophaga agilis]|uniref:Uncharacterized protein n=1 Tax=Xanthocytophaga agilis TaxID=3048010 RepID=A0AAE3R9M1_9BACT|nr:hypothetical protein [Xanthocytophaga agilis]MDJ1506456.1 hypothetical protein [Xanthocytophaga agilis]
MVFLYILLFVGLPLSILAVLPIALRIDTTQSEPVQICFFGLITVWIEEYNQKLLVGYRVPFFYHRFDLFNWIEKSRQGRVNNCIRRLDTQSVQKQSDPKKENQHLHSETPKKRLWAIPIRLLNAFHLHDLSWQIDTGDWIVNAYLYPLTLALAHTTPYQVVNISINFEGRNHLQLYTSTRIYKLVAVFVTNK